MDFQPQALRRGGNLSRTTHLFSQRRPHLFLLVTRKEVQDVDLRIPDFFASSHILQAVSVIIINQFWFSPFEVCNYYLEHHETLATASRKLCFLEIYCYKFVVFFKKREIKISPFVLLSTSSSLMHLYTADKHPRLSDPFPNNFGLESCPNDSRPLQLIDSIAEFLWPFVKSNNGTATTPLSLKEWVTEHLGTWSTKVRSLWTVFTRSFEVAQTCKIYEKKLDTTSVSVLIEKLDDLVEALLWTAPSHKS